MLPGFSGVSELRGAPLWTHAAGSSVCGDVCTQQRRQHRRFERCPQAVRSQKLTGWGRTAPSTAEVLSASDVTRDRQRGARRRRAERRQRRLNAASSARQEPLYGDPPEVPAASSSTCRPSTDPSIDPDSAIVDVDGGVRSAMKAALPYGLWVPVLPGAARSPSAAPADIHGGTSAGSFGNHVASMELLVADGAHRTRAEGSDDDRRANCSGPPSAARADRHHPPRESA